jgi:transcriptional regulator with XRE-family HTH domain
VEDILRRLGQRIREIRIQRGFKSQEEFADYCKLHRTFIGHLETGRKDFRLTTVIRVAQALGITLQELFAGLETGKPFRSTKASRLREANFDGLLRELATLERSIQRLKQFASPENRPAGARNHADKPQKRNKTNQA